jgi:predicted RNA methylase
VLRDRLLADVPHGGRVLDAGAGTGTLAIALAATRPTSK